MRHARRRSQLFRATDAQALGRLRPAAGEVQALSGAKLLSGLLFLLLGGLLGYLFASYNFYVYDAEVVGARHLSPQEVFEASGVSEMSIFYVRPAEVEARLERLPWVKEARTLCFLPNRVRITLQERKVAFVWKRGGKLWGIDEEGVLLPLNQAPEDVLQVEDLRPQSVEGGPGQELIDSVLAVWEVLPEVKQLTYDPNYGLIFNSPEGYPVRLGQGRIGEKVAIWRALKMELAARKIHPAYVDVRYPSAPYYELASEWRR